MQEDLPGDDTVIGNLHLACNGYDRNAEKGISREWNDDMQMKWKHSWLAKENVTEEIFDIFSLEIMYLIKGTLFFPGKVVLTRSIFSNME